MTETSELSELQLKRLAVLASMKKKKDNDTVVTPKESEFQKQQQDEVGLNDLYEAVLDLRSLGYNFDLIVQLSGIQRNYLMKCYRYWNLPLPVTDTKMSHHSQVPNIKPAQRNNKYIRPIQITPVLKTRPKFDQNLNSHAPDWLGDLIIDLESSGEDESEDEEENEEESIDEVQEEEILENREDNNDSDVLAISESAVSNDADSMNAEDRELGESNDDENKKKRSFSDVDGHDLDGIKQRKLLLSDNINALNLKLEENSNIEETIDLKKNQINQNKTRLSLLKQKIIVLENEITKNEEELLILNDKMNEQQKVKESLNENIIQLENLEDFENKTLVDIEQKKIRLKEALSSNMTTKKNQEETLSETTIEQLPPNETHEEEQTTELEQSKETSPASSTEDPPSIIYNETIHKIPKAKSEFFTSYKSFGFQNNKEVDIDQDNCLCPFDLSGKCEDPNCKFQHLGR